MQKKKIVSYRRFVQKDLPFWESETAIFLKPGPRVDKSENDTCVFVCTANLYIFWNDDVISPRLAPSQTPLRHVTAPTTWTNTERLSFY